MTISRIEGSASGDPAKTLPDPRPADPVAAQPRVAPPRRRSPKRIALEKMRETVPPQPVSAPAPRRRSPKRIALATAAATPVAAAAPVPEVQIRAQEVPPALMRPRHWLATASFALLVVLPFLASVAYLYGRAQDQYHSEVAFSIRSEEAASAAASLLGAITSIGSGSASDADILFDFIASQKIVEEIDREIDLRAIYSSAENDPLFALALPATIEDLTAHWGRMTDVSFESGAGIIHVRANAFTPEDAHAITTAILAKSGALVNALSEQAREDAVRFAREELAAAEEKLRAMRQKLSEFRRANRIVDPSADVAGQMGLLNALQSELAQALVERDTVRAFADESDQRIVQANRRIDAITQRIDAERASLGAEGDEGVDLPEVVGAYEELLVDLEFANAAYTQAMAGLSAAQAEARRQSRYLAPHIEPTLAQSALYPRRLALSGMIGLFLVLGWSVLMLIYYNIRDNR
jgi:capsular polysaccharide transport system permease protein